MTPLAFLGSLGPWEVLAILVVALLLFGKRLPEVAKSAGKAVVQFKKGLREVEEQVDSAGEEEDAGETEEAPKDDDKQE